jgi:hypothetical protein
MPEASGSQEISGEPQHQAPMQPPPQPPRNQNPPPQPADDGSPNNQSTAAELKKIKAGESWLIGIGVVTLAVNSFIAYVYYQQLTQMRIATEASTQAVNLASDSLEFSASQFDRAMHQTVDQTVSQYNGTKASIKAANAAKSAADTAKDTLHVSERAYISAEVPTIDPGAGSVRLPIINHGHIPSGKVEILIHEGTTSLDSPNAVKVLHHLIEAHWRHYEMNSLPPQPGIQGTIETPLPSLNADNFKMGTQSVHLVGTISYNDGFGDTPERKELFCYFSLYSDRMKENVWLPCAPEEILPTLQRWDKYPNNEYLQPK